MVVAHLDGLPGTRWVGVDGYGASGKTTLAERLSAAKGVNGWGCECDWELTERRRCRSLKLMMELRFKLPWFWSVRLSAHDRS